MSFGPQNKLGKGRGFGDSYQGNDYLPDPSLQSVENLKLRKTLALDKERKLIEEGIWAAEHPKETIQHKYDNLERLLNRSQTSNFIFSKDKGLAADLKKLLPFKTDRELNLIHNGIASSIFNTMEAELEGGNPAANHLESEVLGDMHIPKEGAHIGGGHKPSVSMKKKKSSRKPRKSKSKSK